MGIQLSEKKRPRVCRNMIVIFGIMALLTTPLLGFKYYHYINVEREINFKMEELLERVRIERLRPNSYLETPDKLHSILADKVFHDTALTNFQGAIRIDTQSFDNSPDPSYDISPWIGFFKLHDYLRDTFPLVHEHLILEKVNEINLLYTWEGSNPDLKPLLLTAHQDTVPVDNKTLPLWKYDPFSGHYDGEYVWGRGSIDCKQLLVGLLETVEKLIKDDFKPERTVILAFGMDEESGGFGASSLNETLTKKYGHDSIFALLDEGPPIMQIDGQWFALPATGEKGRINLEVSLSTPGGHSSVPPDHTSIGIMAQLINLLESNPFAPVLSSKNPYLQFLQKLAQVAPSLPKSLKNDILRAEFDKEANTRVTKWVASDRSQRYMIQTSQAIDVINGGVKSNALPEYVSFLYNSRISVESTVNATIEHVLDSVKVIATKFDLGLKIEDTVITEATVNGFFQLKYDEAVEALPVTPASGTVWDLLEGTLKHVYEDVILEHGEVINTAPSIMPANTDTRAYWKLTENIFRLYGARIKDFDSLGLHSINEHIPFQSYLEGVAFLYEFIQNADQTK